MNLKYNLLRYGIMKRLCHPRAERLMLYLTFRCNVNCGYCTHRFFNGSMPVCQREIGLEAWMQRIEGFPCRIQDVVLSGGEPTLHRDFALLTNWLLDQGYFVTIYTNLMNDKILGVHPSWRLRIDATFHGRYAKKDHWLAQLYKHQLNYRVDYSEIEEKKIPGSQWKAFCQPSEYASDPNRFVFGPDGRLFMHSLEMDKYYLNWKGKYDSTDVPIPVGGVMPVDNPRGVCPESRDGFHGSIPASWDY